MTPDPPNEFGYRHGRQLSHFLVDVTAHGRGHLALALALAFCDVAGGEKRATHFLADDGRQLTLFERAPRPGHAPGAAAFPEPLGHAGAVEFVWDWLRSVDYPPDEHDGASVPGWRVCNETFGIVDGCWEAFIAVRPRWIYLPK